MTKADLIIRASRMKAAARIRDLENELAEYKAKGAAHIRMLAVNNDELRAQIAAKDNELSEARRKHWVLAGQIAAKDAEINYLKGHLDAVGPQIAALREIAEFTSPLHEAGAIARAALTGKPLGTEGKGD